jgi:hypothetical protein
MQHIATINVPNNLKLVTEKSRWMPAVVSTAEENAASERASERVNHLRCSHDPSHLLRCLPRHKQTLKEKHHHNYYRHPSDSL